MQESPPNQLTIHERPVFLWFFGLLFTGMGVVFLFSKAGALPMGVIFLAIGSLILVFTPSVTVTVDKPTGYASIQSHSLVRKSFQEIALKEIKAIELQSSRSSRGSTLYRIAFITQDENAIPLTGYYSSGYTAKERKARQLREFIGVESASMPPASPAQAFRQLTQPAFTANQEGITSGVSWVREQNSSGNISITRWISTDFRLPDGFLFLAQKPNDSFNLPGGLLGGISRMLYEQMLKVYGFQPETLPGIETAKPLEPPEPRLEPVFFALTSQPGAARQVLTPWVTIPLTQWAERHPLQNMQPDSAGQLTVMFSPEGTVVSYLGEPTPELIAELETLGVELVKTQVGSG